MVPTTLWGGCLFSFYSQGNQRSVTCPGFWSKTQDLNSCPPSQSVLTITFVLWCFNNYSLVLSMLFFYATYLLNDLGQVSSISFFWGVVAVSVLTENFSFIPKVDRTELWNSMYSSHIYNNHLGSICPIHTPFRFTLLSWQCQKSNPVGLAPKPLAMLVPAFFLALSTLTALPRAHFIWSFLMYHSLLFKKKLVTMNIFDKIFKLTVENISRLNLRLPTAWQSSKVPSLSYHGDCWDDFCSSKNKYITK